MPSGRISLCREVMEKGPGMGATMPTPKPYSRILGN
jgi:hypothetical protein